MPKSATPALIADIVSGYFGLDRDVMMTRRDDESRKGRNVTFWLCEQLTPHSRADIGRLLGGYANGHVTLGVHSVENLITADPQYALMIETILGVVGASVAAVEKSGLTRKPDPDPLAIAERILRSPRDATLVSLEEVKVLATAVAVTFGGTKGQNHAQY